MSKETLKKLGIFGVSFGLIASPLAFGDMHEDPAAQQADPAADDSMADPNAQGDPAVPGGDPAAQSTDSAADPAAQQADPAAGEPAGDPNAQGDPTQDPGFGDGPEAMPGTDDPAAGGEEEYEYENEEEEAPWDEEGDDGEDEEQSW